MTKYTPEAIEAAEKIVRLTGFGQELHVNDILPDIQGAIDKATQKLCDELWDYKEGVRQP